MGTRNRPTWVSVLMAGAAGLLVCAAWTGVATVASASPLGVGSGTHEKSPLRVAGTRDLPSNARQLLRHRLPDALRPTSIDLRSSASVYGSPRRTVREATNWSGELEPGSDLTSVSATWTVPSVVPTVPLGFAATWIGIGGVTGTSLIQTGTVEATALDATGYAAWVELLPAPSMTVTTPSTPGYTIKFVVAPGDVVHASVTRIGTSEWRVAIGDSTANWTYSHTFSYLVDANTAEWITERPTLFTTTTHTTVLATLADYGSTRFTHLMTTEGGSAQTTAPVTQTLTPILMVNGGNVISAPGPLTPASSATGESFTDSYLSVPTRVYGPRPDDTAASELEHQFTYRAGACPSSPTSGRAVVLATDKSYTDALTSEYLASYLESGILLTSPTSVSTTTLAAIRDEGITHVYVVGGPLAVDDSVVSRLESTPAYACGGTTELPGGTTLQVTRVAGGDEYGTAFEVATTQGATPGSVDLAGAYAGVNTFGGDGAYNVTAGAASTAPRSGALTTAILVSGEAFGDAEAAGTLSYAEHLPILLTTPSTLSSQALGAIGALHVQQIIVMGGDRTVSDSVVVALETRGVSVLRIAGADSIQTAIELAECELGSARSDVGLGWRSTGRLVVARGDFFSDALAGAVVAADGPGATRPEPLLITASPITLGSSVPTFLQLAGTTGLEGTKLTALTILGGPLAVSQTLANTMMVALIG